MTGAMIQGLAQLWLRAKDGALPPLPGRECGTCMVSVSPGRMLTS
jgi:hypothetical protein